MICLLDANVLIALFDAAHVHHRQAHRWFAENRNQGWATCPLTQNACIRILSQAAYPGRLALADITRRLQQTIRAEDHHFWADTVSLCDPGLFDPSKVLTPKHLTDLYLLALCVQNAGCLVTFDQSIPTAAVVGATARHLEGIGGEGAKR